MSGTTKSKMWSGSSGVLLITVIFVHLVVQVKCSTCQKGEFSKDPNKPEDCQPCKLKCNLGLELIDSCNATTDNKCVCAKENQFKDTVFDICIDCKLCASGFYPDKPCAIETRCVKCPMNHFSTRSKNALYKCDSCTECQQLKQGCNGTHNAICDDVHTVSVAVEASTSTEERTSQGPTREKEDSGEGTKLLRTKIVIPVLAVMAIFICGVIVTIWKRKIIHKRWNTRCRYALHEERQLTLNTGLLLRNQPASLMFGLHRLLNPNGYTNWENLAGELGFTHNDIGNFKAEPTKSAENMLASWQTKSSSTVDLLHECLVNIGRQDVADYLAENIKMIRESTV